MNIFKNWYDYFIVFIIIIKILNYLFYAIYIYLKIMNKQNTIIFKDIV